MQIFDTHCHYNLEPLSLDFESHLLAAQKNNVNKALIVGTNIISSQKAIVQAEGYDSLYSAVGIHPGHVDEMINFDLEISKLQQLVKNSIVKAIGEVGLDYYHFSEKEDLTSKKSQQKKLFLKMIEIAEKNKLPLILHVRDKNEFAYTETLEILQQNWSFKKAIIFHCVSGPLEYVKRAIEMPNSYFGFDGNLTFKNAHYQREIFNLVKNLDPKKILLETDAPYLAPEPHRGEICQPKMIKDTASFAHEKLGLDLDLTYQNSLKAFGIS